MEDLVKIYYLKSKEQKHLLQLQTLISIEFHLIGVLNLLE